MSAAGDAEVSPVAQSRLRWWRWPLGLAVVAILCLGLAALVPWLSSFVVASRGKAELAAILTEIDRDDPRWRWEHLEEDRPPVPEEENSVRILREAHAALHGSSVKSGASYSGDAVLERLYGQRPPNRRLDDHWLAHLRGLRGKLERAVTLAMSLSRYPRGRSETDPALGHFGTLPPDGVRFYTVMALLALEHERLVNAGRGAEAAEGIRAQLHAGAAFRDASQYTLLHCRLACRRVAVRRVERLLGIIEVPAETCRRLQDHLTAERAEPLLASAVRGRRAAFHALLTELEKGRVPLQGSITGAIPFRSSPEEKEAIVRKYPPRLYEDHATGLRILHRACGIAGLPTWELLKAWPACMSEVSDAKLEAMYQHRKLLTAQLLAAFSHVGEYVRDQALLSCAVVALAAERYRLKHRRWPESPADLVPAFVGTLPPDPYTGGSLRYARGEEGIRLSCGDPEGKEVAVQLWDVNRRGLPPLPLKPVGEPP